MLLFKDRTKNMISNIVFDKIYYEERQVVMDLINGSYYVETGSTGVAFKNANRYPTLALVDENISKLRTVKIEDELVGVVGVDESDDGSCGEIGPLAVSSEQQKRGIGGQILSMLERQYPVTIVGVVSCRTDILPWYKKRGYVQFDEVPLLEAGVVKEEELTRSGLTYIKLKRINTD